MWTLHPASTNYETATRLWGMLSTLKALLAVNGSFFGFNCRLSVVWIGMCEGVLSDMFDYCIITMSHAAYFCRIDVDAAQSRYAIVLFGVG